MPEKKIHRATVLIVDGGVDVELLTGILEGLDGWDIRVRTTDSMVEARALVEKFQFQIAFVDYVLGRDSSGSSMLKFLKVIDKSMPVVMMASKFDARVESSVKAIGASVLVTKSELGESKVRELLKEHVLASDSYRGPLPSLPMREEIQMGTASPPAPPPRMTPPPTNREMQALTDTVNTINSGVQDLGRGQAALTATLNAMDGRVTAMDGDLKELSRTQQRDIREGTKTRSRVVGAEEDIVELGEKIEKANQGRWKVGLALIGVVVAALGAGGSSVWWAAQTDAAVDQNKEADEEFREQQQKTNAKQAKAIGAVNTSLTKVSKSFNALKHTIEDSNGHEIEFNQLCVGMSKRDRQNQLKIFERQGRAPDKVPTSCLR